MSMMESTITALLVSGKGILAADESFPTIEKRFKDFKIPSTETSRRDYREMLFTTPGLNEFISGVILFDETLRQKSAAGVPFSEILTQQNIIPGIKVDEGTVAQAALHHRAGCNDLAVQGKYVEAMEKENTTA
jgi:fructose-bisphosphate aldolase, class I